MKTRTMKTDSMNRNQTVMQTNHMYWEGLCDAPYNIHFRRLYPWCHDCCSHHEQCPDASKQAVIRLESGETGDSSSYSLTGKFPNVW